MSARAAYDSSSDTSKACLLYLNYLTRVEGTYIARMDNEASLSIEEVCAALKNHVGFTGNHNDPVEYVKQFLDEAAYQVCDGFAVNTGYFSVHPNVGAFDKISEGHDTRKHPVMFRFRTRAPLRTLAEHIVVEVEGLADVQGYTDTTTKSMNDVLTPSGQFSIAQDKDVGEAAEVGVYFVSEAKPAEQAAENNASRLIGVIPALSAGKWKVEIKQDAIQRDQEGVETTSQYRKRLCPDRSGIEWLIRAGLDR